MNERESCQRYWPQPASLTSSASFFHRNRNDRLLAPGEPATVAEMYSNVSSQLEADVLRGTSVFTLHPTPICHWPISVAKQVFVSAKTYPSLTNKRRKQVFVSAKTKLSLTNKRCKTNLRFAKIYLSLTNKRRKTISPFFLSSMDVVSCRSEAFYYGVRRC